MGSYISRGGNGIWWLFRGIGALALLTIVTPGLASPAPSPAPAAVAAAQPWIDRARAELLASADLDAKNVPPYTWEDLLVILVDAQPSEQNKAAVRSLVGKFLDAKLPATIPAAEVAGRFRRAAYCLAFGGDLETARGYNRKAAQLSAHPSGPGLLGGDPVYDLLRIQLATDEELSNDRSLDVGTLSGNANMLEVLGEHEAAIRASKQAQARMGKSVPGWEYENARLAEALATVGDSADAGMVAAATKSNFYRCQAYCAIAWECHFGGHDDDAAAALAAAVEAVQRVRQYKSKLLMSIMGAATMTHQPRVFAQAAKMFEESLTRKTEDLPSRAALAETIAWNGDETRFRSMAASIEHDLPATVRPTTQPAAEIPMPAVRPAATAPDAIRLDPQGGLIVDAAAFPPTSQPTFEQILHRFEELKKAASTRPSATATQPVLVSPATTPGPLVTPAAIRLPSPPATAPTSRASIDDLQRRIEELEKLTQAMSPRPGVAATQPADAPPATAPGLLVSPASTELAPGVPPFRRLGDDVPPPKPSDADLADAARCELALGYARIGDSAKAKSLLKVLEPVMKSDPTSFWRVYRGLLAGYLAAGKFDDAIEMVGKDFSEEDRSARMFDIICTLAVAGQIDRALDHVGELSNTWRSPALYVIAAERVRLGKIQGLEDFITRRSSALERASLNLAIARQILGRAYAGRTSQILPVAAGGRPGFIIEPIFGPEEQ